MAKAAEFVAATAKDLDVYVGVGLSKEDHGPARRCKSEEMSGICGIGTDLDLKSEAHGNKPLPTTHRRGALRPARGHAADHRRRDRQRRARLVAVQGTAHLRDRTRNAPTLRAWLPAGTRCCASSRRRKGWVYDRLSDLARVLRIAGTQNHKDPANPKDVTVFSQTDRLYNLSDFEEFLDDAEIPDPEEEERAAREWKERFADKPLAINPNAAHPPGDARRRGWTRGHDEFRNTWNRQRHDLKDQSGSGYDLALACFGVDAGSVGAADRGPDLSTTGNAHSLKAAQPAGLLPEDHRQG